jgi:hypothetical protein
LLCLQVQQMSEELSDCRQQLQQATTTMQQAQQQAAMLQSSLLQKTAIAEAAQGQLAAAALTQKLQQMLQAAAPAAVSPGAATTEPVRACESLAAAIAAPSAGQEQYDADAKVQRIMELRAALAAALTDAADAASAASTPAGTPGAAAAAEARHVVPRSRSSMTAAVAPALGLDLGIGQGLQGHGFDPKLQRIQELTVALTSAAADIDARSAPMPFWGSIGGSSIAAQPRASTSSLAGANDAAADAKQQRIQELRAALAEALRDKDELLQQLADMAAQQSGDDGAAAAQQLQLSAATQVSTVPPYIDVFALLTCCWLHVVVRCWKSSRESSSCLSHHKLCQQIAWICAGSIKAG